MPSKPIETKPLDPSVVGQAVADAAAKAAGTHTPPSTPAEITRAALDYLYANVNVPDQAAVEEVITSANPMGAAGSGGVGATGATGPAGPVGSTGPAGPKGDPGPSGSGSTGPTGPSGAAGPIGASGASGPVGATGAAGLQGTTGPAGAASTVPGPTGPQGVKGDTGTSGPTGTQGVAGQTGDVGATGTQGIQGVSGPTGPKGAAAPYAQILSYQGDVTSTVMADPGTGKMRWNAITAAATTQLYFDRLDMGSDDITLMWDMVLPNRIIIQEAGMAANTQEWTVGPKQVMPDYFIVDVVPVTAGMRGSGMDNFATPGSTVRIVIFLFND